MNENNFEFNRIDLIELRLSNLEKVLANTNLPKMIKTLLNHHKKSVAKNE